MNWGKDLRSVSSAQLIDSVGMPVGVGSGQAPGFSVRSLVSNLVKGFVSPAQQSFSFISFLEEKKPPPTFW